MVGPKRHHQGAGLRCPVGHGFNELVERHHSIDARLARAQSIQVWPVNEKDHGITSLEVHRKARCRRRPVRVRPVTRARGLVPSQDRHNVHPHCGKRRQHRSRARSGGEGQDGSREALRIGGTDADQKACDKAPANS